MGRLGNYLFGGVTSPMAGDGYGGAPPPKRSPQSPNPPALGSSDYLASDRSRSSLSTRSHNFSSIDADFTNELANGSPQHLESQSLRQRPARSPNGICTPRCSLAPQPAVIGPAQPTRPSVESFRTASEKASISATTEMPQGREEVPWENYEIPQELALVTDDTPQDVRNIIQESMDEHRAMRASRMQSQAVSIQNEIEFLGCCSKSDGPLISESSAMASARSRRISDYSTDSPSIPIGSDTSVQPDAESGGRLKSPTNVFEQSMAASSQEYLRTNSKPSRIITEMEPKFQESKSRTHKSHNFFRLISHRRSKGQPSPDFCEVEPAMSECTGCLDDIPKKKAVGLPCRHKYCSPCFSQLVSTSIQNEASYPPKCCLTDIPNKTIRDNLPPLICAQFEEKALEYAVPVANRFYCVSSTCGKWIDTRHARRTNGVIECPHCATKLCTLCRGPQHPSNEDCPQDFGLDRTLEQAERAGWRRCYNCRAMVELSTGCRHITCKCRAEFCYTCGSVWRTCRCTEADQARREREIRTRLAQLEADQRAEEAEMRAAMEAVEAAERLLREERDAEERRVEEEARELQRQEAERLQKIAHCFEYLLGVLERVRLHQTTAIEKRHDREWDAIDKMRDDLDSVVNAVEREAQVKSERDKIFASTEATIKASQRQYVAAMLEAFTRHLKDQGDIMASSVESEYQDADIVQAKKLEKIEELTQAQELERTTLASEQAREIQKWEQRGKASLQAFDSRMIALKMRLEEADNINKRETEIRNLIFADGKWSEILFEERLAMLAEDERKLIRNGGEAPDTPRRDTIVMSGTREKTPVSQRAAQPQRQASIAPQPHSRREAGFTQHLAWKPQEEDVDSAIWNLAPLTPDKKKVLDAMRMGKTDRRTQWAPIVHV